MHKNPRIIEGNPADTKFWGIKMNLRIVKTANSKPANSEGRLYLKGTSSKTTVRQSGLRCSEKNVNTEYLSDMSPMIALKNSKLNFKWPSLPEAKATHVLDINRLVNDLP